MANEIRLIVECLKRHWLELVKNRAVSSQIGNQVKDAMRQYSGVKSRCSL